MTRFLFPQSAKSLATICIALGTTFVSATVSAGEISAVSFEPLWETGEIEVRVSGTALPPGGVYLTPMGSDSIKALGETRSVTPTEIVAVVSPEKLAALLQGKGRTCQVRILQLKDGKTVAYTKPFRCDLAPVELVASARTMAGEKGVVVELLCRSLLPGYRVFVARTSADMPVTIESREIRPGSSEISLLGAGESPDDDGHAAIRIATSGIDLPLEDDGAGLGSGDSVTDFSAFDGIVGEGPAEDAGKASDLFAVFVTDLAGSRSAIYDVGALVAGMPARLSPPHPAPTGDLATVPDVRGMTVDAAAQALDAAGFSAEPLDTRSLLPLAQDPSTGEWGIAVVRAQGMASGTKQYRGTSVVLACDDDTHFDIGEIRTSTTLDDAAAGLLAGATGVFMDPCVAIDDIGGATPLPLSRFSDEGDARESGFSAVSLRPQAGDADMASAAAMRLVATAIANPAQSEGENTQAIADRIVEAAGELLEAQDDATLALPAAVRQASEALGIRPGAIEDDRALAAWSAWTSTRNLADETKERRVQATGVFLVSLVSAISPPAERPRLAVEREPSGSLDVRVAPQGSAPATNPSGPSTLKIDPALIAALFRPLQSIPNPTGRFEPIASSTSSLRNEAAAPKSREESVPMGKAREEKRFVPDWVNVPDVVGYSASAAFPEVRTAELRVHLDPKQPTRDLKSHDIVRKQEPLAGWRASTAAVYLNIGVPAPDVRGLKLQKAIDVVRAHDLKWRMTDELTELVKNGPKYEDTVVDQWPRPFDGTASDAVDAGSFLTLDLRTNAPDVVNKSPGDARAVIQKSDLVYEVDDEGRNIEITTFKQDVVVSQSPAAGSSVRYGSTVSIVPRMKTPDVVSRKLPNAESLLDQWSLRAEYGSRHPDTHPEDVVVSQWPKAGTLISHYDEVRLGLQVPVPDVRNLALEDGARVLRERNLSPSVPNVYARDRDLISGQTFPPTRYAGGTVRPTLVNHGTEVRLDPVVTRLDDYRDRSIAGARRDLEAEDFVAQYDSDLWDDDRVTGQTPAPGTLVERGSAIRLGAKVQVPNVSGQEIDNAVARIENASGDLRWYIESRYFPVDVVMFQSPSGGSYVNPRTEVRVTPGVYVPRAIGNSPESAAAMMERQSLRYLFTTVRKPTTDRSLVGRAVVIDQDVPPGLRERSRVDIVRMSIAEYFLETTRVPGVSGQGWAQAVQTINGARLRVNAVVLWSDGVVVGRYTVQELQTQLFANALTSLIGAAVDSETRPSGPPPLFASGTDPAAGTELTVGSSVELNIYASHGLAIETTENLGR